MVDTPSSVHSPRTREMKGLIGSFSGATNACILASRIMKLVALVSSSIRRAVAPASSPSMIEAACDVEPLESGVVKVVVRRPKGK